jgi:hypothetical protein
VLSGSFVKGEAVTGIRAEAPQKKKSIYKLDALNLKLSVKFMITFEI